MKNKLIIYLSLIWIQFSYGQDNPDRIDNDYFLIGTLSEYMGRHKYPDDNRVDYYYKNEKSLVLKIYSIFKDDYPDIKLVDTNDRFVIYSKQITNKINDYYIYEPSDYMTKDFDTIYFGKLRPDIFKTDMQKLSFITGLYVRFGELNDSTYLIKIANSLSKAQICVDLLKQLKCSDIKYSIGDSNSVPVAHEIYFIPTNELKEYLMTYTYIRQQESD